MQIAPEQGALLTLFARLTNAKRAVEVGTFTGYSAISHRARARSGRQAALLRRQRGMDRDRPSLLSRRLVSRTASTSRSARPSRRSARAAQQRRRSTSPSSTPTRRAIALYYEEILKRLRPGGLVVFDNVLWMGQVANPEDQSADTAALRELNDFVAADPRVECVMIGVADGLASRPQARRRRAQTRRMRATRAKIVATIGPAHRTRPRRSMRSPRAAWTSRGSTAPMRAATRCRPPSRCCASAPPGATVRSRSSPISPGRSSASGASPTVAVELRRGEPFVLDDRGRRRRPNPEWR